MNNNFNLQNLIQEIKNKISIDKEKYNYIDLENYINIIKKYNSLDYKQFINFNTNNNIKKYNRIQIYQDDDFEILFSIR